MKAKRRPRILMFAGPSGGHLFPAVATAESFKKAFPESEIGLVSSRRAKTLLEQIPDGIVDSFYALCNFPAPAGSPMRSPLFLIKLTLAFFQTLLVFLRFSPQACVGFGSYVSFPGVLLSQWMGVPVVIHEQNFLPGKATLKLASYGLFGAYSFPEIPPGCPMGWQFTGLPLRDSIVSESYRTQRAEKPSDKTVYLVVGGSQGARHLNTLVTGAMARFPVEKRKEIAVIHISGAEDRRRVSDLYGGLQIDAVVHEFFGDMASLYKAADVAVCRAGANTLFELALFGLPAIVVPYPHAGAHQKENAKYFVTRNAAVMFDEKNLSTEQLYEAMQTLDRDKKYREEMSRSMKNLAKPEAAEKMAELTAGLLGRKNESR